MSCMRWTTLNCKWIGSCLVSIGGVSATLSNHFVQFLLNFRIWDSMARKSGFLDVIDCIYRRQERGRGRMPPRRHGLEPVSAATSSSQTSGRSGPFPTQRSFGLPRQHQGAQTMRIVEEKAAAKALRWRERLITNALDFCVVYVPIL